MSLDVKRRKKPRILRGFLRFLTIDIPRADLSFALQSDVG